MHTIFQKFQLGIYIHFSSIALLIIGDVYLSKHLNWTSKNFHKKTIDTWSVLKVGSAKLNTYNYLIIIFSLKRYTFDYINEVKLIYTVSYVWHHKTFHPL